MIGRNLDGTPKEPVRHAQHVGVFVKISRETVSVEE